jgi:hypothetical protein
MDGAITGVPADAQPVALVASDLVFPLGLVAEPIASLSVGSPPLYIQHASLLI